LRTPVSYDKLSDLLPDATLALTESDEESSRYIWTCGCVAIRLAHMDVCDVLWCSEHSDGATATG
jgi:hypothetical protein